MTQVTRLIGVTVALSALAGAALGDELEDVRKKISDAWAKQTSLAAKYRTYTRVEYASVNVSSETRGEGVHEFARQGDKVRARIELNAQTVNRAPDRVGHEEQTILSIIDGDVNYRMEQFRGEIRAIKLKAEPQATGAPDLALDFHARTENLKYIGEQSVGGRKVYVIEATPKKLGESDAVKKALLYFDQESGFLLRLESLTGDDRTVQLIEYTDIKLGVPIPEDRFVFTPPPGVEVFDGTQGVPPPPKPERPTFKPAQPPATQPAQP